MNKMKEYRQNKNMSFLDLSLKTGISSHLH